VKIVEKSVVLEMEKMEDQDDMSLVQRLVHKGQNIREELRLIFQGNAEK